MMIHESGAYSGFVLHLASLAVRSLVLAGAAGLALTLFPVEPTSSRIFTWKAVLYAALGLPLLSWLLPALPISSPAFLREQVTSLPEFQRATSSPTLAANNAIALTAQSPVRRVSKASDASSQSGKVRMSASTSNEESFFSSWSFLRWDTLAIFIYLTVSIALLARLVVGLILTRRLAAKSQPISDSRITDQIAATARVYRMNFIPAAFESDRVAVPITLGTFRPVILLPSDWREWTDAKLNAVIAHEMSHVERGDALTHVLSLLHRATFWFSPFSWWLDRHLTDLAEQASDEAALSCGADRNAYARTLLDFFEALQLTPGRVRWQGVSMAKTGQAQQRLERILTWKGAVTMTAKKSVVLAIAIFGVPVLYVAAAARPVGQSGAPILAQTPAPVAAQNDVKPVVAPAPAASPQTMASQAPEAAKAASARVVPDVPVQANAARVVPDASAQAANASVASQTSSTSSYGHGYSYSYGFDDEQRFVIVSGKSDGLTMSGSSQDAHHVEKLKKSIPGDFIWFQRDEKSYIIRDQATVDRARALWLPQEELGRKQEALGKQQEELGRQQEALGKKMEEVRVKVPDMTAEIDRLKAKLQKLGPTATVEQIGELQSEIGELQSKMGDFQSQAGEQQSKYGEEQGKLGEEQGKLGEQQGKLGEQQAELAKKATQEMKTLLDEALKNGTAKPEAETGSGGEML